MGTSLVRKPCNECQSDCSVAARGALPAINVLKTFLEREDVAVKAPRAATEQSDWHSLQGFRTKDVPTTPGVYVHQGQKVVVSGR